MKLMSRDNEGILNLINAVFSTIKDRYQLGEIGQYDKLLEMRVVKISESDSNYLEINFDSILFNEALLIAAEQKLDSKPDALTVDVLRFAEDLKEYLLNINSLDYQKNNLDKMINGFKAFLLQNLNSPELVYSHFIKVLKDKKQDRKERMDFISVYFKFLIISNTTEENILKSCMDYNSQEKYNHNFTYNYLRGLSENYSDTAESLTEYACNDTSQQYLIFIPPLLVGLFPKNEDKVFASALSLFEKDKVTALKALSDFAFSDGQMITKLFELLRNIEPVSEEQINLKSLLFCRIIENNAASDQLKADCIKELRTMLQAKDPENALTVLNNIQYNMVDYEFEKYYLLNIYIENTKNLKVLKHFFYNYKDPQYLFEILVKRHELLGLRGSIELFKSAINRFFDINREETEAQILHLFNFRNYSFLALKIILCISGGIYHINLLKGSKEAQMQAVESMCSFPYSIDDLLILLLKFRESSFKEVRQYLQDKLSELVLEVYHELLLDAIKLNLGSSKIDQDFLKPLEKALEKYLEIKKFKEEFNDLNPIKNERALMDLYYSLEHEVHAKIPKDINEDKNSFLYDVKTTVIVRAKSMKNEYSGEIRPLVHFESKMMIDSRAYKNPLLYEQNLENF
ncbi:hypothetical protein [Flavobacterium sp. YO64]|uniref:hypothetical protein n=1 Tax=Flavobacterium sp. YO64 TaxID=394559 RepID=UPI0013E90E22|nr:hypothetical protein [Flavobacterium sp. YO64]